MGLLLPVLVLQRWGPMGQLQELLEHRCLCTQTFMSAQQALVLVHDFGKKSNSTLFYVLLIDRLVYSHLIWVFFPQSFVWSLAKMGHPTWRCLRMQLHLPLNSGSKYDLLFCNNSIRKEVSKGLSGFSLSPSGLFHSVLFCQMIWKIYRTNRYSLL